MLLLVAVAYPQSDAKPTPVTPRERAEASVLAVDFFTALEKSLDVDPLIDRFFISDFAKRNKFCRTVPECGGFARDFWGVDEKLADLDLTEADFRKQYSNGINQLFLYYGSIKYLTPSVEDHDALATAEAKVKDLLAASLKDHPDSRKLITIWEGDDKASSEPSTAERFRKELADRERLVSALRVIARDLKSKKRAHPSFSSKDFRIDVDDDGTPFFNYPKGTRFIEVWPEDFVRTPFKMDLVKEGSALKIVAIYPPMD